MQIRQNSSRAPVVRQNGSGFQNLICSSAHTILVSTGSASAAIEGIEGLIETAIAEDNIRDDNQDDTIEFTSTKW